MACSTQVEVFAAAARGSCDCCMLCAHNSLLHPPSVELRFNRLVVFVPRYPRLQACLARSPAALTRHPVARIAPHRQHMDGMRELSSGAGQPDDGGSCPSKPKYPFVVPPACMDGPCADKAKLAAVELLSSIL